MEDSRINEILISLREMLKELNESELNMVEDFITNQCGVNNTDENDEYPNFFRLLGVTRHAIDFDTWVKFIDSEPKEYP
jgi:hypothetical protein